MRAVLFMMGCGLFLAGGLLRADDAATVAEHLASQHLAYIYGSEDLRNGGLDCSGFVQVVFREAYGIELPNEADKQLDYCREHGQVWDSTSGWTPETLQPGDLIFFAGPYDLPRESRVIHVMVYCGHDTMAGAQALGRQEDGAIGGVGEYYFKPHYPSGILGESGERFIGHRRVFAYGRVFPAPTSSGPIASIQKSAQVKTVRTIVPSGSRPFGASSRVD